MIYNIYSVKSLIRSYLYNDCATAHHPCTVGHPPNETSGVLRSEKLEETFAVVEALHQTWPLSWKNDTFQAFQIRRFLLGKFPQLFRKASLFRHIFSQRVATQEAFNVITSEVFQDSNRAMLQSLRFSWNKVLPHHAILLGLYHTQPHIHSHQIGIFRILNFQPEKILTFPAISNATWAILFKILVPVEIGMLPGISSSSILKLTFHTKPFAVWFLAILNGYFGKKKLGPSRLLVIFLDFSMDT